MARIITIEIDPAGDITVDVEGCGRGREALRVQEAFAVTLGKTQSHEKLVVTSIGKRYQKSGSI